MRAVFLLVFFLGLGGIVIAEEESQLSSQEGDGPCYEHCSGTYPEHTYPVPEDHTACARGCRIAIMDALMSWPFPPDRSFCPTTCKEAYSSSSSSSQLYACQTGCNVTTVDQKVPNAYQIYKTNSPNKDQNEEIGMLFGLLDTISQQLPPLLGQNENQAQLTQHAETLNQLLPVGGKITTLVVVEGKEGSVQIKYEEGVMEAPSSFYEEESGVVKNGEDGSMYRVSCPWNYTSMGRFLSLVGVVLILVAVVTCCCSSLLSEENQQRDDEEEEEGVNKRKLLEMKKVLVQSRLKSPLSFSPGYPQPLPYYSEKKSPLL